MPPSSSSMSSARVHCESSRLLFVLHSQYADSSLRKSTATAMGIRLCQNERVNRMSENVTFAASSKSNTARSEPKSDCNRHFSDRQYNARGCSVNAMSPPAGTVLSYCFQHAISRIYIDAGVRAMLRFCTMCRNLTGLTHSRRAQRIHSQAG